MFDPGDRPDMPDGLFVFGHVYLVNLAGERRVSFYCASWGTYWFTLVWSKETPTPGRVFFLACFNLKRQEEEEPQWKKHPLGLVFFQGGTLFLQLLRTKTYQPGDSPGGGSCFDRCAFFANKAHRHGCCGYTHTALLSVYRAFWSKYWAFSRSNFWSSSICTALSSMSRECI